MRLRSSFGFCLGLSLAFTAAAATQAQTQGDVQVEAGAWVESPDGRARISVDRLLPVVDGEPDRYAGQMLVRLTSSAPATTQGGQVQFVVEASQVRLLNPPKWLNADWAGIAYNIAKNADGMIYVNAATRTALQVEQVGLQREMRQQSTPEYELTSFEVARLHETTSTRFANVVYLTRSVFPLVLAPVPASADTRMSPAAVQALEKALRAYEAFAAEKNLQNTEPEQASETLSPDEKHMALLVCSGGRAALVVVPVTDPTPEATLQRTQVHWLPDAVQLTACIDAQVPEHASSAEETPASDRGRFTTNWKDASTVLVEKENFDDEGDPTEREALIEVTLDGKVTLLSTPAPAAAATPADEEIKPKAAEELTPAEMPAPAETGAAAINEDGKSETEAESAAPSRPRLTVTTRIPSNAPADTAPAPAARPVPPDEAEPTGLVVPVTDEATPAPAATTIPTVAPTPEPTPKPSFFRRLIPGRSRATPAPPSGPPSDPPPPARTPID